MFILCHELETAGDVGVGEGPSIPDVDVPVDVVGAGGVGPVASLRGRRRISGEPQLELFVVPPVSVEEFFGRVYLQGVFWHVVEDVEQSAELEFGQVGGL